MDQVPEGGARAEPAARFQSTLPLVEAKFLPPTRRQATIDRPRLLGLLMATGGPRVVAITAPPGYGKTTLLAQWLVHEPRPVAWLTVDDLDNDPAVLLSYLAAALDRILPVDASIRSALSAPRERILTTAVPRLATALDAFGRPAALVLDDVHRLVDRTSLDALTALLDHLPPSFRVVIAGRREPDLGLARRRAAGDLLEIGTDLLALTDAETAAIAEAVGHPLGPEQARALTARTEGWVAGVHLATLDQSGAGDGVGLLGDVSGRDRYIAAYFRSEFQRGLSGDADLTVLTRTSILETVTTSSAVAVSGIPDAGERIEAVARASLLVQELGAGGTVYRYHNLLRDFLAGELDRREPDARPDLHRRAAAWHLAARDLDRAVSHAIASGDRHLAAGTVTAVSLPTFYGGHPATVDRWISSFDVADFERQPAPGRDCRLDASPQRARRRRRSHGGHRRSIGIRRPARRRVGVVRVPAGDAPRRHGPPGTGRRARECAAGRVARGGRQPVAGECPVAARVGPTAPRRRRSGRCCVCRGHRGRATLRGNRDRRPGEAGRCRHDARRLGGGRGVRQEEPGAACGRSLRGDPALADGLRGRGARRRPSGRSRRGTGGPGSGSAAPSPRVACRAMVRSGRPAGGRPGLPGAVRAAGRAGGPPGGGADRPPPPGARGPGGRGGRDATAARCRRRDPGRIVHAHERRAPDAAAAAHVSLVPGDRGPAPGLPQHRQDARHGDLREAPGVVPGRGGGASRGAGVAGAVPGSRAHAPITGRTDGGPDRPTPGWSPYARSSGGRTAWNRR